MAALPRDCSADWIDDQACSLVLALNAVGASPRAGERDGLPRELTMNKRILSYTTTRDRILLTASLLGSICAGATLPLMNLVFGWFASRGPSHLLIKPQRS